MKKIIIILYIFLHGCAATNKGSYQEIEINSNVIGASVELDGVEIGKTPFKGKIRTDGMDKVKVKVKTDYAFNDIKLEKRGGIFIGADTQGLAISSKGTEGAAAVSLGIAVVAGTTVVGVGTTVGNTGGGGGGGSKSAFCASPSHNVACIIIGAVGLAVIAAYITTEGLKSNDQLSVDLASKSSETLIKSILGASWEYSPSRYYVELKQEDDSYWDFLNDVAIRYYSTTNHSQIAIDAGNDGGEYVDALADLMKTKKDRDIARQDINEALEKSKGDQALFGDELIARFRD